MFRLRFGITLILLSWFPFAQIIISVAHANGHLQSEAAASSLRLVVWTIQILVGFVGLFLVGKTAIPIVKKAGWKRVPKRLWQMFRYGEVADGASPGQ